MKVIKALKLIKQSYKAKEVADLHARRFPPLLIHPDMLNHPAFKEAGENMRNQYLAMENKIILEGVDDLFQIKTDNT